MKGRIFERFYQVDSARAAGDGRGSELGLAIAREIVKAHKGAIRVETPPGGGSRFVVCLPWVGPADPAWAQKRHA